MKHITYIILASALLTCSSCSDFLEKYPKDSPSTTIPMSDDLAVAMTNGCYRHSCISPWQYNHVIQRS